MAFVFFVEVDNKQPKYLMKVTSSQDMISIYRSTETDVVLVGEHRDRIYQSSIEKCKELDCSQFYTSAFTTGAVSLCADCEEFIPGGGGDGESGPCSAYNTLNSVNFTPPAAATPLSNSNDTGTLSSYNSWVSSSNNQAISRSGYWLGMNVCNGGGSQYQCIVSCSSGNVAGCYPNSSAGSVGNVYTIGGSKYQVYDAMQLITSGFSIPTSGTFPLLSGNPTTSAGTPGTSCGRTITTVHFAGDGNSNCITDNGHNDKCKNCMDGSNPKTGTLPTSSQTQFPNDIALFGDHTNTVLSTGSNCYSIGNSGTSGSNGANASLFSGCFALGGGPSGTTKPTTIGAAGLTSFGSCGECIGKMLSDSNGSKGPGCCLSACNRIGINVAPTRSGAGTTLWSEGSDIWSKFWPGDTYDQKYRTPDNSNSWGACLGNTTANSIYSLPCNPTSYCDNGSASLPTIVETNHVTGASCSCSGAGIWPEGTGCIPSIPPTNPPIYFPGIKCSDDCTIVPNVVVGYSNCPSEKSYAAYYNPTECSVIEDCAGTVPVDSSQGSGCGANIPVIYDKFFSRIVFDDDDSDTQTSIAETTKSLISSQLGADAGSCGIAGPSQAVGNVTHLTISGLITCDAGGGCPTRGSTSGYFAISQVRTLLAAGYGTGGGASGETSMSTDQTASCCLLTIQSPWTPSDNSWNVKNCKDTGKPHLNWVQEAFGKDSKCRTNPNPCDWC